MKKFTKKDFKKMALLGIAGGAMVASQQASANDANATKDYSQALALGCGGSGPVGHQCGGATAYRNDAPQSSMQNNNPQGNNGSMQGNWQGQPNQKQTNWQGQPNQQQGNWQGEQPQVSSGCGGVRSAWGQGNTQPRMSAGCGGAEPSRGQGNSRMSAGCGGAAPSQGQGNTRMSAGCGGAAPSQGQGGNSNPGTYTQWETADNTRSNQGSMQPMRPGQNQTNSSGKTNNSMKNGTKSSGTSDDSNWGK